MDFLYVPILKVQKKQVDIFFRLFFCVLFLVLSNYDLNISKIFKLFVFIK